MENGWDEVRWAITARVLSTVSPTPGRVEAAEVRASFSLCDRRAGSAPRWAVRTGLPHEADSTVICLAFIMVVVCVLML